MSSLSQADHPRACLPTLVPRGNSCKQASSYGSPRRARLILLYSTSISTSGITSLTPSSAQNRSAHAASSSVLAWSMIFTPHIASDARSHPRKPPSTTSTRPAPSPPKNALPLEHSSNARRMYPAPR
uniref:Uncharacterized protein n=1 Tax=Arundo donax TaxID=35708 RepID=A0A0A8YIS2_ARUDO